MAWPEFNTGDRVSIQRQNQICEPAQIISTSTHPRSYYIFWDQKGNLLRTNKNHLRSAFFSFEQARNADDSDEEGHENEGIDVGEKERVEEEEIV